MPPGTAKENWAILRALSAELEATLPFDSVAALRRALVSEVPHLGEIDAIPENQGESLPRGELGSAPFGGGGARLLPLQPAIARASPLMAELSAALAERRQEPHGGGVKRILALAILSLSACEPAVPVASDFIPEYRGVKTRLLDGDLVQFEVTMTKAQSTENVGDYAECAAAQVCPDPGLRICAPRAHKCRARG